ncbi:Chondroitin polymerase [Moraxella caviae]|nr:Chondroitin polymerase [Moraxella caviae]
MPVYNTCEYLSQCLESIIAQDIDKEIIAIDDGSTDGSGEVLAQFAERYDFIKIISQENKGVSAARNAGIKAAAGRYVYFVDSDDYLLPNLHFADYLAVMDKEQAPVLCGCLEWALKDATVLPALPKVRKAALSVYVDNTSQQHYVEIAPSLVYIDALIHRGFFPACFIYIIHTEHLRRYGIYFNETLTHCEDTLFVTQLLTCCEFTMIETSERFYYYRHRQTSITSQTNDPNSLSMPLAAVNHLYQYLLNHDFSPQMRVRILLMGLTALGGGLWNFTDFDTATQAKFKDLLTPEIYGMYQLYHALNLTFRGKSLRRFGDIEAMFKRWLDK